MTHIALLSLLIGSIFCADNSIPKVTLEVESGTTLKKGDIVAFGGFGYSSEMTAMAKLVIAYRKEPDAEKVFWLLAGSANAEAALYGLHGLAVLGSSKFDDRAKELSKRDEIVEYGPGGCVVIQLPVKAVVEQIAKFRDETMLKK